MSDKINKKCSNVTIDQMIEHMTADLQTSDGQYIPLGFTPPSTPNDSQQHNTWNEYAQNHFTATQQFAMNRNRVNYAAQVEHGNYSRQPPGFNNFIPNMSNTVYLTDPTKPIPPNHLDQRPDLIPLLPDLRGAGYILYNHQNGNGAYLQASGQDLSSVCGYIPTYSQENRDFGMYMPSADQNSMYVENSNSLLNHQQQEMLMQATNLKNNANSLTHNNNNSSQQQSTSTNRTPLIENLVGNWVPNTSGTYSPFGNASQNSLNPSKLDSMKPNSSSPSRTSLHEIQSDYGPLQNTTNRAMKKPRMVAEVKPMRPSYSDVLAKSVPMQSNSPLSKNTKIDAGGRENVCKNKTQISKKNTNLKMSQIKSVTSPVVNQLSGRYGSSSDDSSGDKNSPNNLSPHHKCTKHTLNSNNWTTTSTEDLDTDKIDKNASRKLDVKNGKKADNIKNKNSWDGGKGSSQSRARSADSSSNFNFEWQSEANDSVKNTEKLFTKGVKRVTKDSKTSGKFGERNSSYGVIDKPPVPGRRGQRFRRRENPNSTLGILQRSIKQHLNRWSTFALYLLVWLFHLISDVCSLSVHLAKDLCSNSWVAIKSQSTSMFKTTITLFSKIRIFARIIDYIDYTFGNKWWAFWTRGKKETRNNGNGKSSSSSSDGKAWHISGLENNIPMPSTGEEAMKRLLACKGKDPYSILGVTPDCTDDDIKRYYKRQAFLVHPDKNPQPGAEEAFKILVHAFDIIGEPERRQSYDRKVAESHQVEQAWSELNDLLSQLHQKMEYAANTIRCTNCTKRHRRIHIDRPCYAARMCAQCKIHHSAKEGDIWAESTCFGFLWYYYACMDGAVYDITEWASCQRANLRHLRPNTHQVQYRIVLGKQAYGQSSSPNNNTHPRHRGSKLEREPDLEEFLNNLYQKTNGGTATASSSTTNDTSAGAKSSESARNRKKNKRKK